jgi:VCBS repeat-containing protein
MSQLWKLMPLAVVVALGTFLVFGIGDAPSPALANVTDADLDLDDNVLTVEADLDQGDLVVTLSSVESDTTTDIEITDCNGCDEEGDNDDTSVTIDTNDPQFDDGTVTYTLTISCPDPDVITITATQNSTSGEITYECEPSATSTATATTTSSAARTVVVQATNQSLGCANTTIITITVRGANGQPVAAGTLVNIQASIGAVSPTSGQTTADGSVFVFYTAPQNQGGTATITALAGSASGSTTITVNCNVQPTQAPPPTTAPSTGIQPPNTGDGGLSHGSGWQTYAGIALIVASVLATLVVVRPRA